MCFCNWDLTVYRPVTAYADGSLWQSLDSSKELRIVWSSKASCCIPALDGSEAIPRASVVLSRGHIVEGSSVLVNERIEESQRRLPSSQPGIVQQAKDPSNNWTGC